MRKSYYIISNRDERNIKEFIEKVRGSFYTPLSIYKIKDSDSELFIYDMYDTTVILDSERIPEVGDIDMIGKRRGIKKTKLNLENKTGYYLLKIKRNKIKK